MSFGMRANREVAKYRPLFKELTPGETVASRYQTIELKDGEARRLTEDERDNTSLIPDDARYYRDQGMTSRTGSATTTFEFVFAGKRYRPHSGGWRTSLEGMNRLAAAHRLLQTGDTLSYKKYFDDFSCLALTNFGKMSVVALQAVQPEGLCCPNCDEDHRTLPPDDHRPRRPGSRPDLR